MPVSQREREQRQDRPQAGPERLGPRRSLVGREMETVVLAGRLRDPSVRLLTLTGPAGVGKSRLAAEAAAGAADFFDEVRFVDLAREALPERAPAGHVLLVLDGCDQPDVPPVAGIGELIASNDRLVVLATGQEPLRVYGERLLPVAPLPVPETLAEPDVQEVQDVPSVALFIRRARDADPGFALTAENVAAVAEICALLEGLPLAVELAAGRLRLFPPHVLLARLRHRTTILAGGPVDAPERHRSLTALARWSCRRLDSEQRAHLEQLAVFERGFGLAMLVRVGAEDVLEPLIDKNLLTVVDQEQGEPRFAVPEPVRSYLLTALDESGGLDAALDRHAGEYQRLVTATEPRLAGTEQEKWLGVLAAESGNISAALRRLRARGDREAVAALVTACRQPWLVQGRLREGLDWCDSLAEDGTADGGAGALPEPVRARLVDLSGSFTSALGDPDLAVRRHRRALALCKRLGDRRQGALVTARMGMALLLLGDPPGAQAALAPALVTLESLGAAGPAAEAATALAGALRVQGETRKGKEVLDRALDAYRRIRDPRGLATALRESAAYAEDGEDLDAAGRALRESLRLYDSIGERTELPATLESFALLLLRASPGQQPRAVRLIAAADALRRSFGGKVPDERWGVLEEALAGLRERLHWTGFATAWAEGLRLTPCAAVAEALAAAVPAPHAERESPAAQPLTPRQVQVAMLVSEGLTNRQIAGQLGISEWTVVNHVRQVMRRLNCTSRVQVAWSVGRWP